MSKKPTVLMILDGYGLNDKTEGNAVALAKTPVMDGLMKEYPYVKGNASRMAVGLPEGADGKLRGWTLKHGCRPYCISGTDPYYKRNPGRRFFPE